MKISNMEWVQVNGDDPKSVRAFAAEAEVELSRALTAIGHTRRVVIMFMTADTPGEERSLMLKRVDESPDDEVYLLASCETMGEGINTKAANMVVFVSPKKSHVKIIQNIGREVRLKPYSRAGTVLVANELDGVKYRACATKEERDALIWTEMSTANGDFSPIIGVVGAVREDMPDFYEIMTGTPLKERREHYAAVLGETMDLDEAVEVLTGERTDDVAGAATRAGQTIQMHHDSPDSVVNHGEGAAVETIVEVEPGEFVPVRGRVDRPPSARIYFVESPFLLSLEMGDLGTALIRYEKMPDQWDVKYEKVKAFVAANGRFPNSKSKNKEEKRSGKWVGTQKSNRGKHLDRDSLLESIPGWEWSENLTWEESFEICKAFVVENNRFPNPSSHDEKEKKSGLWVATQKKNRGKSLDRDALLELIHGWKWAEKRHETLTWEESFEMCKAFVVENNRFPNPSSPDEDEKKSGRWVNHQKSKRGKNLDKDALLESIPGWQWSEKLTWEESFEICKAFVTANGRFPNQRSPDKDEQRSGRWVEIQKMNRGKNLDKDALLESIPGWEWSEKLTWEERFEICNAFVSANGRFPNRYSKNKDEKRSGRWVTFQKSNRGKNLNKDALLESIPGWKWPPKTISPEADAPTPKRTKVIPEPPKRTYDDMTEDERRAIVERSLAPATRGYASTNPVLKDDINATFVSCLPASNGHVLFLDHTEFKTARALQSMGVPVDKMIIPQNDEVTYDLMSQDPTFGDQVCFGDFNEAVRLTSRAHTIRAIYADFTCPLAGALEFIQAAKTATFDVGAPIAITITLRNPEGVDFENADVAQLCDAMHQELGPLRNVRNVKYGAGAPMLTIIKTKC